MDIRHSPRPVGFRLLHCLFHPLDPGHHKGFYRSAVGIPVPYSALEKVVSEPGRVILSADPNATGWRHLVFAGGLKSGTHRSDGTHKSHGRRSCGQR